MKIYSQPMTKVLSMMVAGSVCEPVLGSTETPPPTTPEDAPLF